MDYELYHWGWKKKDAKYIKRERKNGKWVYTYREDDKQNGKVVTDTKDSNKLLSSKTTISTSSGQQVTYNRGRIDKAIDEGKEKIKNYINGVKQDWKESKDRGTEKAIEEATKYDGGVVITENGTKNIGKTTFKDTDDLFSGSTTIDWSDVRVSEVRRGKLDRFVDTAKEYVKDRLGYDERDALDVAAAKYEYAQKAAYNYQDIAAKSTFNMGKTDPRDGSVTYTDAEKKRIENMERRKEMLFKNATKAGKEASEAADAYFNTVLGKLDKARTTGEKWFKQLFDKKKRN